MSIILDRLLVQSATMYPATVALSPESVTVLLFASGFLDQRRNWLDKAEDPLDEVTDADWDTIEKMVANAYEEIMTGVIGFCFPVVMGSIPNNCLWLEGGTYAREDYPVLYSVLDGVFIIDADNFTLPDMRSRVPVAAGTGTGLSSYAVGETGGEETHQLTVPELASHQHSLIASISVIVAPGAIPVDTPTGVPAAGTGFTGGDVPHNNLQPFLALRWAVVAQ